MSPLPRDMQISRTGTHATLTSRWYPEVRGGTCEYCGVINPDLPGDVQYKLCPHYAGMDMKCSYCKETANHPDVVRQSKMIVRDHPYLPNQLITVCGSYECTRKFKEQFNLN